jgi:hypothetical protein
MKIFDKDDDDETDFKKVRKTSKRRNFVNSLIH